MTNAVNEPQTPTNDEVLDLLAGGEGDREHLTTRLEYIRREMDGKESVSCPDFHEAVRWALMLAETHLVVESSGIKVETPSSYVGGHS